MKYATTAELEALAAHAHPESALARALAELAHLRGTYAGWAPPTSWNVVSGDSESAWLDARDEYLTASDVAAVVGVNKYKSRAAAVRDKAMRKRIPSKLAMRAGQHMEAGIISLAAEYRGRNFVRLRAPAGASVLVAHPTIPRLAASLDGVELDESGRAVAAVEAKCTRGRARRGWMKEWYGWPATRVQLQVQMACAGLDRGHIILSSGTEYHDELDVPVRTGFRERLPSIVEEFWSDVHALRARLEDE